MKMRHTLAAILANITDNTEAVCQVILLCQLCRHFENVSDNRAVLRSNVFHRLNMFFRYNQDMHRRLRIKVVKRQNLGIFIGFFARYFPICNLTKYTIHADTPFPQTLSVSAKTAFSRIKNARNAESIPVLFPLLNMILYRKSIDSYLSGKADQHCYYSIIESY